MAAGLAGAVDAVRIAQYCTRHPYAWAAKQTERAVQCDLLREAGDAAASWSLRERVRFRLKRFCDTTSSHGIPWVEGAPNTPYRVVWILLLLFCCVMFVIQANSVIAKYRRNEKITSIQLKFETAPFPAITLCNLNPYKESLLRGVEAVQKILKIYQLVLKRAGKFNKDESDKRRGQGRASRETSRSSKATASVLLRAVRRLRRDAEFREFSDEEIVEALGFKNMSDEVAIVTKARENVIFAMGELSDARRAQLSIKKNQLIHKCSFNGQACDIESDFTERPDPTYGNCFVFNGNVSAPKLSVRAGANYGLRVLVFVNTSDYLPITEAVGVRLSIHDADEYPFPETSGYSAPTGFVSSYGVRLARISRLPEPYGQCVPHGETPDYIYRGFRYSLEGCYRTCLQEEAVRQCGCGDPRFPVLNAATHCQVFDPAARRCLERIAARLTGGAQAAEAADCRCVQPCEQPSYTVSYSCANWPSASLNISVGQCDRAPEQCNEYYAENAAMIEVFYEALNYEVLSESEAYGIVKMMADFGGQLGLWSGVSVLTCCEIFFLACEVLYMLLDHHRRTVQQRLAEIRPKSDWSL